MFSPQVILTEFKVFWMPWNAQTKSRHRGRGPYLGHPPLHKLSRTRLSWMQLSYVIWNVIQPCLEILKYSECFEGLITITGPRRGHLYGCPPTNLGRGWHFLFLYHIHIMLKQKYNNIWVNRNMIKLIKHVKNLNTNII